MRLSPDQIKEAILHPEMAVRDAATWYFARSFSLDTSIMPRVIEAIGKYGWGSAFSDDIFMEQLAQSESSVDWVIQELSREGPFSAEPPELDAYVMAILNDVLLQTPPRLLQARQAEIRALSTLDDETRRAFEERVRHATLSADDLWAEFERFYPRELEVERVEHFYHSLTAAMADHRDELGPTVAEMLNNWEELNDENWLLFLIRAAGDMRLESVANTLAVMAIGDDWQLFSAVQRTLAQIGSDALIERLVELQDDAGDQDQLSTAFFLECIPTDRSVAACLELQKDAEFDIVRIRLIQAALMNFATEAIQPAVELIRECEPDSDIEGLQAILLIVCELTGERFPEFEEWSAAAHDSYSMMMDWYRPRSDYFTDEDDEYEDLAYEDDEFDAENDDDFDEEEEEFDEYEDDDFDSSEETDDEIESRPAKIIKQSPHVGRNDPCPCGSGKKFKKCCYQKMAAENAADATLLKEIDDLGAVFKKAAKSMQANKRSRENIEPPKPTSAAYEIKITLERTSPPVWRRVMVPDMTLGSFHGVIQSAMGWNNEHAFGFKDGKTFYSIPSDYSDDLDVRFTLLSQIVGGKRKRFEYTYDFGDNWVHSIQVERILLPEEATRQPVCLAGENACPPEDIGGVYGYANLVEVCNNPDDDRREDERYEYLVDEFDPQAFDRDAVNAQFQYFNMLKAE